MNRSDHLFIRGLERPSMGRRWRWFRWLPYAIVPMACSCVTRFEELLGQIGIDLSDWCSHATTLAVGEEGGV